MAASTGGVAGYSWGTIENCSVSGSVSGTVYVGGVVGAQRTVPSPDAVPLPQ